MENNNTIKEGDLVWAMCGGVLTQTKVTFRYNNILALHGFYDYVDIRNVTTDISDMPEDLKSKAIYWKEK